MQATENETFNDLMQRLAARFRENRKRFDVSQKAFGELMTLSQATIARMEGGEISWPLLLTMLVLWGLEGVADVKTFKSIRRLTANTLKRERRALDLSKWRLAKYLGVSASTVGLWESGKVDSASSCFISLAIQQLKVVLEKREELGDMTAEKAAKVLLEELATELDLDKWMPQAI